MIATCVQEGVNIPDVFLGEDLHRQFVSCCSASVLDLGSIAKLYSDR